MNLIKENFATILLISLILIILLGFVFFIYRITIENNSNNMEIAEIPEFMPTIDNDNNTVINEEGNNKEIISFTTTDEKDTPINDSTLSKIANIFNNCNVSQKMRLQGYIMNAMTTKNKIKVFSGGNSLNFNIEFILDNNILYTEVMYNEADPRITAIKVTLAIILVDCVGQVKGYPEGALCTALGDEVAMNYTIENEGVEIKQLANGKDIVIKVDLNSDFLFLNI